MPLLVPATDRDTAVTTTRTRFADRDDRGPPRIAALEVLVVVMGCSSTPQQTPAPINDGHRMIAEGIQPTLRDHVTAEGPEEIASHQDRV
jgi:hypothetical protein